MNHKPLVARGEPSTMNHSPMNHSPLTILLLCILSALALSGGCKSPSSADPELYPWHGPITDGTNGIVQPPRW